MYMRMHTKFCHSHNLFWVRIQVIYWIRLVYLLFILISLPSHKSCYQTTLTESILSVNPRLAPFLSLARSLARPRGFGYSIQRFKISSCLIFFFVLLLNFFFLIFVELLPFLFGFLHIELTSARWLWRWNWKVVNFEPDLQLKE